MHCPAAIFGKMVHELVIFDINSVIDDQFWHGPIQLLMLGQCIFMWDDMVIAGSIQLWQVVAMTGVIWFKSK